MPRLSVETTSMKVLLQSKQGDFQVNAKPEIEQFKDYLASKIEPGWHVVSSELENNSSNLLTLIAEPYGTPITVPPGGKCEIVAEEPEGHSISLTFSDSDIQVWANGLIEVFQDGVGYGTTSNYVEWRQGLQDEAR